MTTTKKARPSPWTDAENAGCCALYLVMQRFAATGKAYNKAGMIRVAQGNPKPQDLDISGDNHEPGIFCRLAERSRPSIEMKLMNLSAVMESIGRPELSMSEHGYRAMPNYQSNLKTMAVAILAVRDAAVAGQFNQVQA